MKKLFYFICIVLIANSCSEGDLVYSCDPEIDAIVKSGEIETSELTLVEFLEYDLTLQKALFSLNYS